VTQNEYCGNLLNKVGVIGVNETKEKTMKTKYLFLIGLMALALTLSACAPALGGSSAPARTLNVTGNGTVSIAPDTAYIYIGVHTEEDTATTAVASNNAQTQRVIDALKAAGVADKDIRTSNFNIYPSQQYGPNGEMEGSIYMVDNTVYITVRDLGKLGETLDAAVKAGANSINSIQFDVADKSAALSEARALAMKNAQAQADELSAAADVKLGDIQNISYYDSYPAPIYEFGGKGGGGAVAEAALSVPIAPGEYQITASVSVSYELK